MENYNNYYYHTTAGYKGTYCALDRISSIFNDGKIKVDKNRGSIDGSVNRGIKRNYLCDPSKPKLLNLYSSLELFVSRGPSLALKKNLM